VRLDEKKKPSHLGFLTALGSPLHGLIGGFLVLNLVGRPVEFHCTAPVRPNKAQEILYGATLESFVCGEQIAPALVGRTKLNLNAILTNNPNMLTALPLLDVPIGLVLQHVKTIEPDAETLVQPAMRNVREDDLSTTDSHRSGETAGELAGVTELTNDARQVGSVFYESLETAPVVPGVDYSSLREAVLGKNCIALPVGFTTAAGDKIPFEECVARVDPFLKSIDSVEPFERIRLAVEEAQKSC
jgi:hypothetical protein